MPDLRPTGDRIRETLFNWLQAEIPGAVCLDLFAGSGALGLEALSRGAEQVVFVDSHSKVIQQLKENCSIVNCVSAELFKGEAQQYLQRSPNQAFDVVFLDPPFRLNMLTEIASLLESKGWLKSHASIYVEMDLATTNVKMPESWKLAKEKQAGQVKYQLWRKQ